MLNNYHLYYHMFCINYHMIHICLLFRKNMLILYTIYNLNYLLLNMFLLNDYNSGNNSNKLVTVALPIVGGAAAVGITFGILWRVKGPAWFKGLFERFKGLFGKTKK